MNSKPTSGLDVQTRNALWAHLEDLNREGTTIFLTTQYLEEADRLCGRLAIIDHGKIVVEGSPEGLKDRLGGEVVEVTLPEDSGDDAIERAARALQSVPGAGNPTIFDHSVAIPVPDAGRSLSDLVRRLDEAGVTVEKLNFSRPTLDEVFLKFTGERMRVEETASVPQSSMGMMTRRARRG